MRSTKSRKDINFPDMPHFMCSRLVHSFAFTRPPGKSIDRTFECNHQAAILVCNPRRAGDNDDLIADAQRLMRDAGGAELGRSAPLDGPPLHLPVLIGGLHLNESMRIPKRKLHELALQLDLF